MLAVWGERGPIVIRWRRGRSLIFSTVGLGTTFPLLRSTTGMLFLGYMPEAVTRPIVEREIEEADGKHKRVNVDALIADIRKRGYTTMEGHLVPGVWSASAPVLDSQGEIVAGLTVVGNATDGKRRRKASTAILIEIAAEASAALGWGGD